ISFGGAEMRFYNLVAFASFVFVVSQATHADTISGPHFPPPGGVSYSSTGTSARDSGGVTTTYTSLNPSAYGTLYWGPTNNQSVNVSTQGSHTEFLSFDL